MGRGFLKKGFKATYVVKDRAAATSKQGAEPRESSLFLAMFDKPDQAREALQKFKELLAKNGTAPTAGSMQPGLPQVKRARPLSREAHHCAQRRLPCRSSRG